MYSKNGTWIEYCVNNMDRKYYLNFFRIDFDGSLFFCIFLWIVVNFFEKWYLSRVLCVRFNPFFSYKSSRHNYHNLEAQRNWPPLAYLITELVLSVHTCSYSPFVCLFFVCLMTSSSWSWSSSAREIVMGGFTVSWIRQLKPLSVGFEKLKLDSKSRSLQPFNNKIYMS